MNVRWAHAQFGINQVVSNHVMRSTPKSGPTLVSLPPSNYVSSLVVTLYIHRNKTRPALSLNPTICHTRGSVIIASADRRSM